MAHKVKTSGLLKCWSWVHLLFLKTRDFLHKVLNWMFWQVIEQCKNYSLLLPARYEVLTVHSFAGYGNMSPTTTVGQIFCVFFALFGIPLNVVVLNRVGKYMLALGRNLAEFIEMKTKRKVSRFSRVRDRVFRGEVWLTLVSFLCLIADMHAFFCPLH